VIKHREFGWHGVENNVLIDNTTYHQRSNIEATFSRFGENTARSFEREPGSTSSANSFSNAPSETPEQRSTALTGDFRRLNKAFYFSLPVEHAALFYWRLRWAQALSSLPGACEEFMPATDLNDEQLEQVA